MVLIFDIIIVGGGAAGLSAAITARARNKNVMIIGNSITTSALYKAEKVNNYPGMAGFSGKQMLEAFVIHGKEMGVVFETGKVRQILSMGDYFSINAGESFYECKTVILSTGKKQAGLIKGEKEFVGKGVSYCATCDGMLYKGKTVVIAGDNEESLTEMEFLTNICGKVYYVTNSKVSNHSDILTVIKGGLSSINGEGKVSSVTVNGEIINCDGVFIIGDSLPAESLIYGVTMENGDIVVDKNMKTNIPGCFAAGDCTGKPYQISKATGEGLIAALSASEYLRQPL